MSDLVQSDRVEHRLRQAGHREVGSIDSDQSAGAVIARETEGSRTDLASLDRGVLPGARPPVTLPEYEQSPSFQAEKENRGATNLAAWLPRKHAAIEVAPAPYTSPGEHEIVVENRAVAINPIDWGKQAIGDVMYSFIKYPFILGEDLAGEVVAIGRNVSRFKPGDRVVGHALAIRKERNNPAEGAFQNFTVIADHMASPIPDSISYESAAVLPLALSTAACGLFQKDYLALQNPSVPPRPNGETLLIWGGSTSVGCNAIQLAVAAGYEVIATASPRNFGYLRKLGASEVFDYRSRTVIRDIIAAFKGRICAGAMAIGAGSASPCVEIVGAVKGNKFVTLASAATSLNELPDGTGGRGVSFFQVLPVILQMLGSNVSLGLRSLMRGVRTKFVVGDTLANNEVGRMIYVDFLPGALAAGQFTPAPDPYVVGNGLDCIQTAFDVQKNGVSARKVVVTL
jgi:D-arabinose 1-dehydrogenase-like Zn-dependent alcohol dehydrogenase